MKSELSRAEYLQIVGLLALADRHARMLTEIRQSVGDLLGISEGDAEDGHISDAVWDDNSRDADLMLRKLKVTVKGVDQ